MPTFRHYDLSLLNPAFDSPLVDVLTELEHLRPVFTYSAPRLLRCFFSSSMSSTCSKVWVRPEVAIVKSTYLSGSSVPRLMISI
jgi:hypothetical protein